MRFDGATYDHAIDSSRLGAQMLAVFEILSDRKWHTLHEISETTGSPEASISARIRDLRKERFGSYVIDRRRVRSDGGLWEYRMIGKTKPVNVPPPAYCHLCEI